MANKKWRLDLHFSAHIEVEAPDEQTAIRKGQDILDAHSVYEDDRLDIMHDEAFCAGGTGDDPPLKKKRAYMLRNEDFQPTEPIATEINEE